MSDKWATPIMIAAFATWVIATSLMANNNRNRIEAVMDVQMEIMETMEVMKDSIVMQQAEIDLCDRRLDTVNYRVDTAVDSDKSIIEILNSLTDTTARVMADLGYK